MASMLTWRSNLYKENQQWNIRALEALRTGRATLCWQMLVKKPQGLRASARAELGVLLKLALLAAIILPSHHRCRCPRVAATCAGRLPDCMMQNLL
jgi:hypothetical protein